MKLKLLVVGSIITLIALIIAVPAVGQSRPPVPRRLKVPKLRFCDLCKERGPWEVVRMHYYSSRFVFVNDDITPYQVNVCTQCRRDHRRRLRPLVRM